MHKWSLKEQAAKRRRQEGVQTDRKRVFLDVSIGGGSVGRVVVRLAHEVVPQTADNFRMLCTGEMGRSARDVNLHLQGSPIHRVERGFIVQGGDIVTGTGTSGECAVRFDPNGQAAMGCFDDENFVLKHDVPGCVSMANRGPNTNNSQFFITLAPAPHLDGNNVCFGHVVKGMEVVHAMTRVEVQDGSGDGPSNVPKVEIRIDACGELPFDEDSSDAEGEGLEKKLERESATRQQTAQQTKAAVAAALGKGKRPVSDPPATPSPEPAKKKQRAQKGKQKSSMMELGLDDDDDSD
eukprot:TRINITY_DN60521_c0_g1_i1.p1 TRINITY_DN60521_c0_g1~~TRINITY_DN60521_c0_g1_i1.p1  ORF type:complete len:294 (+),score=119.67 TRINITY_DN60521_c0_g1_i1:314-1195(+)